MTILTVLVAGYRPIDVIVAGIGVLVLAVVIVQVIGLGIANARHARDRQQQVTADSMVTGRVDRAEAIGLPDTPASLFPPEDTP